MEQQLLQEQKKPNVLAFQVALLFSFYSIALTYASELMGLGTANVKNISIGLKILTTLLTYIPFIGAIMYVQTKHKKELGGYITFGRAFSTGFKVSAYAGLFIAILTFIYYKVLNPAAMDQVIEFAISNAKGDENQIKGIEMMSKYMVFMMMFSVAVTFTFTGLIISLITAAIIKKDNPNPFGIPTEANPEGN
ncbi:DUF4199 domain-containing protein [Pedobacter sp.]|uniref:DUF4199 domain-containing protein n=1 Tax=Pedobacter sp. TaxID=1411316 RepID=UPI0031CE3ED9